MKIKLPKIGDFINNVELEKLTGSGIKFTPCAVITEKETGFILIAFMKSELVACFNLTNNKIYRRYL